MLKVMIVDNESAIRKGLIHCIRWEDLGCVIAAQADDGIDAMEQIPEVFPDIVISDIRMPGMDGLALTEKLRIQYPHIKVIILTGFPDFEYAQKAISFQIVDFVLKPTSVDSLTRAIEKAKKQIAQEGIGQQLRQELKNKETQNLMLQRRMLLRDLLQGAGISQIYLLNRMAQLKLDLSEYFVIRMDIAPLDKEQTGESKEDDLKLLSSLYQAQEIITSCLSDCPVHFVTKGTQVCYGIVEAGISQPLKEQCVEAVTILNSIPEFLLYIGISCHHESPLHMHKAAAQADQAAQFARYTPEIPVVMFTELPTIPAQVMENIYSDLRHLQSAIENQNPDGTSDILKKLFAFIRQNKMPVETVKNICLYIHQFCMHPLLLPVNNEYIKNEDIFSLKQMIDRDTIEELEENMLSFVSQILNRTGGSEESVDEMIHKVKTFISKHYAENLSLDYLASKVHLSPSYLSRLFKKETGENLSTYVQNMRIEEAKILLKTTDLKTYEVGERVGIPDPVYFSRIFKKVTGMKPKDYKGLPESTHPQGTP